MRGWVRGPLLFALLMAAAALGPAEKLPLKIYTSADGLAHNSVNRIVRDSRGYLWFCTSEGLSRFDGYEFHSYGRRDGLPHRAVNDLLETRSGEYWVATAGGLCRYVPRAAGKDRFRVLHNGNNDDPALHVDVLLEDRQGRVWCGTGAGLFQLDRSAGLPEPVLKSVRLGLPKDALYDQVVSALLEDSRGDLWVGSGGGLYRLHPDGSKQRYSEADGLPSSFITSIIEDRQRRIWVGTHAGLCKIVADPIPGRRVVEAVFRGKDGLGTDSIAVLHKLADGTLCVGTKLGLSARSADRAADEPAFSAYTASHGLPASGVEALAEDSAGNLWIGTDGSGAAKLVWKTFVTYTADDGLRGVKIDSVLEDRAGRLCVVARNGSEDFFVNEFDGERFHATRVNLPIGTRLLNWGARAQTIAQDDEGNWWIATSDGLVLYSGVRRVADLARATPAARYTERDGLPGGPILSVFEDSAHSVWVSTAGARSGLARWNRATQTFHSYSESLPWLRTSGVSLFAEDGAGELWLGFLRFGSGQPELARLRGEVGERFGGAGNAPSGGIRALYVDTQQRLWVGTDQNGVMRFDHPASDQPAFRRYTTADGLSSDVILSLSGDKAGKIYVGSGSGVDRLNVVTGQVKRYTSADGLAPGEVYASFCDRNGELWFGTAGGLSRLQSPPSRTPGPPRIAITSLRLSGVLQPTSELGETEISGLRLQPNQNDLEVGFAGLAFAPGETLHYQYMLEGADSDWSAPSLQRTVNFANLPADSYRFLVRAINSDGIASARPASISFLILPPVWLRWWFQLLAAATGFGAVYWLHRYRVRRLLEVERVRTRIATDLHDDIGSSLSQIAILSEVASRHIDTSHSTLAKPLTDIANISRELVDSMSDIVWAIDPEQDHLGDLLHRMRRFASDLLAPRDIELAFRSSTAEQELQMGADLRRQIFLIFKEAVHNVLRHSGATKVSVDFQVAQGWLNLAVEDNGRGFAVDRAYEGHGLRSMRDRARELGGSVEIESSPGATSVRLRIPVGWRAVHSSRSPHE